MNTNWNNKAVIASDRRERGNLNLSSKGEIASVTLFLRNDIKNTLRYSLKAGSPEKRIYPLILVSICFFVLMLLIQFAFADDAGLPQKIGRLNHGNAGERIAAAREIAKTGKSREADTAMAGQLAAEKDPVVRRAIYESIGRAGGRESAKALADKIKTEDDKGIRPLAILALGKTQDESSVTALRAIFLDEKDDMNARRQAGNALSNISTEASVRAVAEGLKDKNPGIRLQAASSLSRYMEPVLIKERLALLKKQAKEDTDADNRKYIQEHILKAKFNIKE